MTQEEIYNLIVLRELINKGVVAIKGIEVIKAEDFWTASDSIELNTAENKYKILSNNNNNNYAKIYKETNNS